MKFFHYTFFSGIVLLLLLFTLNGSLSGVNENAGIKEWILSEMDSAEFITSGSPEIVDCPYGKAVSFNGINDAFFVDENPLVGLSDFTVEVIFNPSADGEFEQRFLHMGEITGNRMLFELRMNDNGTWYLDTFMKAGENGIALMDSSIVHPSEHWYHAALVYEKGIMKDYVNKNPELSGEIDFPKMSGGSSSIGVRLNKISWFKGKLYKIRITGKALTPEEFMDF